MSSLDKIVAAHPLSDQYPYSAIKFAGIDHVGTPVYRVAKEKTSLGAEAALRVVFKKFGAHCFYCGKWMPKDGDDECTLDHLRPQAGKGSDFLHNFVFACRPCNRKKGPKDVVNFSGGGATKYLRAIDEHLARCLMKLGGKRQ